MVVTLTQWIHSDTLEDLQTCSVSNGELSFSKVLEAFLLQKLWGYKFKGKRESKIIPDLPLHLDLYCVVTVVDFLVFIDNGRFRVSSSSGRLTGV